MQEYIFMAIAPRSTITQSGSIAGSIPTTGKNNKEYLL